MNRREVLGGLAGLFAGGSVNISPVLAQGSGGSPIQRFYLAVTKRAYEASFGDMLAPENVANGQEVVAAIESGWKTYHDNMIAESRRYMAGLDQGELEELGASLGRGWRKYRGFLDPLHDDALSYTRGGRTIPAEENTNPLFGDIYALSQAGVISGDNAADLIGQLENDFYPERVYNAFNYQVGQALESLSEPSSSGAAPSGPSDQPLSLNL